MSKLKKFAVIHPLSDGQRKKYENAFPDIEFSFSDASIPLDVEQVQAAAIHWTFKQIDELLAQAPKLEWLHIRSTGVEHLAQSKLFESTVTLTNGSGNHAPNIAEHVLAMMLAFARQIPHYIVAKQTKQWLPVTADRVFEVSEQHLVIVGLGSIGLELAKRAKGLGMDVTGVVKFMPPQVPDAVDKLVNTENIDQALATADHVVLALPLTDETRNFINAERLSNTKRGAYVYNIGRGQVVDQNALIDSLSNGHLGGAGLDVTDPEPLPPESPLWSLDNVIITAHTAGATPRSYDRFEALVLENIRRFVAGQQLVNVVNKAAGF